MSLQVRKELRDQGLHALWSLSLGLIALVASGGQIAMWAYPLLALALSVPRELVDQTPSFPDTLLDLLGFLSGGGLAAFGHHVLIQAGHIG